MSSHLGPTYVESGPAPPRVISISDTLATAAQVFGPFDTQAVGTLSLTVETGDFLAGADVLIVFGLTRKIGLPWMPMLAGVRDASFKLAPICIVAPSGYVASGPAIPAFRRLSFFEPGDESILVAQPVGNGVFATLAVGNLTFTAFESGDWGNAIRIEFVDPGAPNQPLGASSPDGWTIQVLLETDGSGDIVTVAGEIDTLLNPSVAGGIGDTFAVAMNDSSPSDVAVASGPTNLSAGDSGATGVSYEVSGSY